MRELERRDLCIINQWRNDPELIGNLGAPFRYINSSVDEAWFEHYLSNREHAVRCAITDETDRIIGLVSLVSIDSINQSCEFHIMIGEKNNQNKGAGSFAVREMLHHAFMNLNMNRVELSVLEENLRAIHLYEKSGFVFEGKKRQSKFKNGSFHNVLIYSMIKSDYCDRLLKESI